MNERYGLTEENLLRTLPSVLRNDESMAALASSIAKVLSGRVSEIESLLLYARIDQLPEELLDILAYDFKVDWWDADFTLEEKRRTLKDSWRVHRMLGTKAAVELAVSDAFGTGKVSEWFEYGGEPYHFKVSGIDPGKVQDGYAAFLGLLRQVRRLSAVLDSICIQCSAEHRLYTGFSVRIGRHITVGCEIPAELDVTYLTDEDGYLLTDEIGARIIDEEG